MIQTRSATLPDITELQVHFLAILPTIEQYAELTHRHLVNFHDREDAIAETIALTWAWYHAIACLEDYRGIDMTRLAVVATRYVRAGRLLCSLDRGKGTSTRFPTSPEDGSRFLEGGDGHVPPAV